MGALETTLIGGAVAAGGWFVWKRMHEWSPDGAGASIARTGTSVANQLGRVTEVSGSIAGGAVRTTGEVAAKTAGLTVSTAGAVATKLVPGARKTPSSDADTASDTPTTGSTEPTPAPKAKKRTTKKRAATKRTAKKAAADSSATD